MIAFLSNMNIDPIKMFFKEEKTYFSGYNQYLIDLINEDSVLYTDEIETVVLFLDGEEFLKRITYELPTSEVCESATAVLNDLFTVIRKYIEKKKNVTFLINNFVLPPDNFITYLDFNTNTSFSEIEVLLNKEIKEFSQQYSNMLVLDWQRIVKNYGYANLHDDKFWYLGRIKLNNKAFSVLKEEIANLINSFRGRAKKVLVLDLDNTLWGGIIGEEGINGIKLSEDGIGKAYRDFQNIISALKKIGVLLAINSKNNEEDVKEVFEKHPMMILNYDDFIVKKVNWNNKVQNMTEIAEELNLGLDSFVFIDDNHVERQIIKDNLPEVIVPVFPEDAVQLKDWMMKDIVYKYFPKVSLTKEDREKTEQYKANVKRIELSKELNLDEFIKSLNIKLTLHINPADLVQRIAQMSQKTNQFNMTTKRYTENDIEQFMRSDDAMLFAIEYEDNFGKEGIIGMSVIRTEKDRACIDSFLMSCRVIGRNVEYVFLYKILEVLGKNDIRKIEAEFIPTKKNVVAKHFYRNAGLNMLDNDVYELTVEELMNRLENKLLIHEITVSG